MKMSRYLALILFVLSYGVARADQVNLVVNGGFETGDFSGWTLTGNTGDCLFVGGVNDNRCDPPTQFGGHSGDYAAQLGDGGSDAYLSQNIATVPGASYDISFWLASQGGAPPANDFSVFWGGQQVLALTNIAPSDYTFYNVGGLSPTGSQTTLMFAFRNDPAYLALDDVSVVDPPAAPMPEPSSFITLGLVFALFAMATLVRKARRAI